MGIALACAGASLSNNPFIREPLPELVTDEENPPRPIAEGIQPLKYTTLLKTSFSYMSKQYVTFQCQGSVQVCNTDNLHANIAGPHSCLTKLYSLQKENIRTGY